jgi:hypothetical protein
MRLPTKIVGTFDFQLFLFTLLGLLFTKCFHLIFLLLYKWFYGQHLLFSCFWFLNYHLTMVPCWDESKHFVSIILKILSWLFNVVFVVCGL